MMNQGERNDEMAAKAVERLVEGHPFLEGFKAEHLQVLANNAMRVHYEADEFIFLEGSPANRFYLLEKGQVALESHLQDGPRISIETIGAGDVLGWSWLFPPYYWNFDARALEPTTALFFYGTRLREQCEQDHDLGYEMMKRMAAVLIRRLQATRKKLLSARV
jgi:CRP/FNR family transcriptional regulator, cyclic AMP receptor protein